LKEKIKNLTQRTLRTQRAQRRRGKEPEKNRKRTGLKTGHYKEEPYD
jgi:hypothetical protein